MRWATVWSSIEQPPPNISDGVAVMYDPKDGIAYWLPRAVPTEEWLVEERARQEKLVAYWRANPASARKEGVTEKAS